MSIYAHTHKIEYSTGCLCVSAVCCLLFGHVTCITNLLPKSVFDLVNSLQYFFDSIFFVAVKLEINWICRPMQKCMSNNWSHLTVSGNQSLPNFLTHYVRVCSCVHTYVCVGVCLLLPNFAGWLASWSGNQTSALLINVLVACEKSINSFRLFFLHFYWYIFVVVFSFLSFFFFACPTCHFSTLALLVSFVRERVDLINTSIHQSSALAEFNEAHYCA